MYEYRMSDSEHRSEMLYERMRAGHPLHSPPHHLRTEAYYLLTAACFEHNCILTCPGRRRQLLAQLLSVLESGDIAIRAWAILPNHYHVLVQVSDFAKVGPGLRLVHGVTAREWNLADDAPGRQVWYRYADRAIRDERHYYATLNYIHYNPVKHGWAKSPYEWEASSVGWYKDKFGVEWLRDCWQRYPVREYGRGWDDGHVEDDRTR